MMYSQPQSQMQPQNPVMMQMQNTMGMAGMYNQMQPQMQTVGPNYGARGPRRQAPTFPGYDYGNKPQRLEPNQTTENSVRNRPVSQAKIKATPKTSVTGMGQVTKTPVDAPVDNAMVEEPQAPSAAEMLMGDAAPAKTGKSAGRDYLMELLKK
jgi:hypothetical protein